MPKYDVVVVGSGCAGLAASLECALAGKKVLLIEQHNIPVPTDYQGFVNALAAFEAAGVRGFAGDWGNDYACLELMQGCAIPLLMSREGKKWRMEYESETEDNQVGLDDTVWPKVFEKYEQFLKDVRFQPGDEDHPGDEELTFSVTMDPYFQGKTAMVRNTAALADNITVERGMNSVILPYFGQTSEDNWLLTYPMCQVAVSKQVEEDEAKREAVMEVLMAMFSEEGQKHVAAGTSVLSYNKEVNITPSPALRYVQDCIASNHLYMRLASTEVFAISQDVGHRMMTGEYDAKAAYNAFDAQITDYKNPDAAEVMFTQESAYSNEFTDHGSAAASSLMNTIRSSMGADIAIGYSPTASTSIYAGDYTLQQAKWVLTARNSVYLGEYTGEEVWRFMDWLVNVKEDGSNPIQHRNLMPVTSGLEYTVTEYERGKFRLEKVTVNGEPLDENATYNLMLVGADTFLEHETFCNCPMPADLKEKRQAYLVDDFSSQECMQEALEKTRQFQAPTEYVTILQG